MLPVCWLGDSTCDISNAHPLSVCSRDIPLHHATGARDERLRRPEAEGGVLGEVQEERRAGGHQEAHLRDRRRDRGGVQDLHGAQQ